MKTTRTATNAAGTPVALGIVLASRWVTLLLALNLGWEFGQLPLYSFPPGTTWQTIAQYVAHCTLGDGGIALGSYIVASLVTRCPDWPLRRPLVGLGIAIVASLVYTVWAEWRNVYVLGNWAYADTMPTVAGIGVSPLMQWIVLPGVALLCLRWLRHRSSTKPIDVSSRP